MAAQREDGYLVGASGGNMYCHGMATLALSQLYGMTGDDEVKPVLKKAVDLIVRCQSQEGGWRYNPEPTGADISVTIMQVMALRAAKNSGMHVPDATLKKAIEYINTCYDPPSGGFTYMPGSRQPGFARTAAGVCVLQLTGAYDAKEIPKAIEYLKRNFEHAAALLVRPLLRLPRHAPGRRQGLGRLLHQDARAAPDEPERRWLLEPSRRIRRPRRPRLPDLHRRHRPVGAGTLPADLPALAGAAARCAAIPGPARRKSCVTE